MSSISGISSYSVGSSYSEVSGAQRRSKMAEELFSKLDSTGKGYIEESDLESALSSLASTSSSGDSSTVSASDIFNQLDSDSDGKVTQDEMSSGIEKLAEALDSQFNQSRMEGAMPPPPPPSESDTGFTEEELTSQLSEIGSTDSARSSLISDIVENFDAADTDEDGKVSFTEAMAYENSKSSSSTTDTTSSSTATSSSSTESTTSTTDAQILRQIMELMRSYGTGDDEQTTLSSLLSISA